MKLLPECPPGLTRARFDAEVLPGKRPVILRGVAADWPAVAAARASAEAFVAYLMALATGEPQDVLVGGPEIGGRFGYRPDLRGLNFVRARAPLGEVLTQLLAQRGTDRPPALALQAATVASVLPGFTSANVNPLLDSACQPRIWIGNAASVAIHHDPYENVAVAVSGRRRFTLFPPDQVANLYIGPLETMPAGVPTSLVDPATPDLERFPRFGDALDHAEQGELAPGDAIYMPYGWWHHVASLDPVSVLVNYWWNPAPVHAPPLGAMLHAFLAIRALPPDQRATWHAMFEHFVFETTGPAAAHLPAHVRGVLGEPDAQWARSLTSIVKGMAGEL